MHHPVGASFAFHFIRPRLCALIALRCQLQAYPKWNCVHVALECKSTQKYAHHNCVCFSELSGCENRKFSYRLIWRNVTKGRKLCNAISTNKMLELPHATSYFTTFQFILFNHWKTSKLTVSIPPHTLSLEVCMHWTGLWYFPSLFRYVNCEQIRLFFPYIIPKQRL